MYLTNEYIFFEFLLDFIFKLVISFLIYKHEYMYDNISTSRYI